MHPLLLEMSTVAIVASVLEPLQDKTTGQWHLYVSRALK